MDILIKGGLIVDGTGEKPFYGDIAIDRDMITEIGENLDASKARKVVDAKGLTVTPGFIDGHTFGIKYFEEQTASQCSLSGDLNCSDRSMRSWFCTDETRAV